MSLALLFPGQGSQFVGMAQSLAAEHAGARRRFEEADDLLGFSLSQLMFEGPESELLLTRNAQPAILLHSVVLLECLRDRLPDDLGFVAGHSLGEFSAWVAAGSLEFADALKAVRLRGELMFEAGFRRPGTMAALLGLSEDGVIALCAAASQGDGDLVVPANLNSEGQIVISGDVTAVTRACALAPEFGARKAVPLSVSGAFHSPLMVPAREALEAHLEGISMRDPVVPVISNVTAQPVITAADGKRLLVAQLTEPVRWADSIETMVGLAVTRFIEVGPGSVLSGLNRRNAKGIPSTSVGSLSDWVDESGASAAT
jgi:[acyl-carrier-protein] S-malonyltransferase